MQVNDAYDEQIAKIEKALAKRMEDHPYKYLAPIGKVEEFLDHAFSGKHTTSLMSSANGTGKTTSMAGVVANLAYPNDNPFFQQPNLVNFPYLRRGRIASDTATVKGTIVPELLKMLPSGMYEKSKEGKDFYSRFKLYNKKGKLLFDWDIMTYEQDPKQFESANLGIVMFDEPPPFPIYTASRARLKLGGYILIWATPLGNNVGTAWMYQKIVSPSEEDRSAMDFFYMTASKEDACIEHGIRGFLPHEAIEKESLQYPEEEILPRIWGEFAEILGRVVKEYDEKIHVLDTVFDVTPEDYAVVQLWDTHPRVNEAVMWVAIDRKGTAFVVDELWINMEEGLSSVVKKIKDIDSKYRIVKRLIDPSAFNVDKRMSELVSGNAKGLSFADILQQKYGMKYEPASKRRSDGISMMREALRYNYQAGKWIKYPSLFIFPHCVRTRWEFLNWMWDEWSGVSAEKKDPKATPQDRNDHFMEDLGRFFLEGIKFTEPVQQVMAVSRNSLVDDKVYQ